MPPCMRSRAPLRLEALEDRLALSWGTVPPVAVAVPSAAPFALNANSFRAGAAAISRNEVDFYRFTAPRTGPYRVQVATPTSALDTVLGLYDGARRRLAHNDDISAANPDSRLTANLTAGRAYFFGVTNFNRTRGGSYVWSVQGPTGPRDDAFESNDTLASATNLNALTSPRTLPNLVMADAADWFRFTLPKAGAPGSGVSIRFNHALGDLDLRLTDAAGRPVRFSAGVGDVERVSTENLPAGTYNVQAHGAANPSYALDLTPGTPPTPASPASKVLYLNFDGATLSNADLVRYAGSDWAATVDKFDADGDGVTVQRFLANRADREVVIARILQLVQEDVAPFGIEVRRHAGRAVEGIGATTIFLGNSTLSSGYKHVASGVDIGNNNKTDIAFIGDEDWGTAERTGLALADATLHEAGHTWGLWHVQSGDENEVMGMRYSVTDPKQWVRNTAFLDRTFEAFTSGGVAHGPGPQNSYRTMLATFVGNGVAAVDGTGLAQADRSASPDLPCCCPACRGGWLT